MKDCKGLLGILSALIIYITGAVSSAWVVLIVLIIIDYVTGIVAACVRQDLSSSIGYQGAIKKAGIILLTVVCMVVDYLLSSGVIDLGFNWGFDGTITFIVCIWFIGNELMSILENLGDWGVPIPVFLTKLFKKFKEITEESQN